MKTTEQSTGVLQIDAQTRALVESAATIRAQLVAREVQLETMRSYATNDNPEVVQMQQQISALQQQLARLGGGSEEDAGLLLPKGKVPGAGLEYVRRLRDVKYHETVVELLARQYEMAKIDEARQGAVIQVVDTAAPPDTRSFPKRSLTVACTFVIGFVLAYLYCVGVDGWRRWKRDPEVARRLAEFRVR
jgi:capsule polysaccharide export protein KpsE/RkpR